MVLEKKLEQLGLTEKEAKVYMALLELGQAVAQDISSKAGINRATTYVILESLIKNGLASSITQNKKTFFIINNPLQILDLLYKEKKDVEEKIGVAKTIMPELEILERLTSERAKVKFFEGVEGIKLIQKDISRSKAKHFDNITNINLALKYFPYVPEVDHRHKVERSTKMIRTIFIYDPKLAIPKLPVFGKEERRYIPGVKFPFNSDFVFYKDKAALVSLKDNIIGVVIENKAIVEGLKTLFELAWNGADDYKSIKGKNKKKP